jgi:hypothetical protein
VGADGFGLIATRSKILKPIGTASLELNRWAIGQLQSNGVIFPPDFCSQLSLF